MQTLLTKTKQQCKKRRHTLEIFLGQNKNASRPFLVAFALQSLLVSDGDVCLANIRLRMEVQLWVHSRNPHVSSMRLESKPVNGAGRLYNKGSFPVAMTWRWLGLTLLSLNIRTRSCAMATRFNTVPRRSLVKLHLLEGGVAIPGGARWLWPSETRHLWRHQRAPEMCGACGARRLRHGSKRADLAEAESAASTCSGALNTDGDVNQFVQLLDCMALQLVAVRLRNMAGNQSNASFRARSGIFSRESYFAQGKLARTALENRVGPPSRKLAHNSRKWEGNKASPPRACASNQARYSERFCARCIGVAYRTKDQSGKGTRLTPL